MKTYLLNGESVQIVKELTPKSTYINGKEIKGSQIVDKDGHWVQVKFLTGPNKGNLVPTTIEKLV